MTLSGDDRLDEKRIYGVLYRLVLGESLLGRLAVHTRQFHDKFHFSLEYTNAGH